MYYISLIHTSTYGLWGCFYIIAIANCAASNMAELGLLQDSYFSSTG